MKSIQIREAPSQVYQAVADAAKLEGRSLSQQALLLLAQATGVAVAGKEKRQKMLASYVPLKLKVNFDSTSAIREDRDR